jgi:hypothetical protein
MKYRSKFPSLSILQIADFWKISKNFHFATIALGLGIHWAIALLGYSFASLFSQGYSALFLFFSITGQFAGSCVVAYIYQFLGIDRKVGQLWGLVSAVIVGLLQLVTLFGAYFSKSFAGLTFLKTCFFDWVWCSAVWAVTALGFRIGQRFPRRLSLLAPSGMELRNPLSFADLGFVLLEFAILKFVFDDIFTAVLDDYQFDRLYILALSLLAAAVVALRALRRTVVRLQVNSERWQEGHFAMAAILAALCAAYEVALFADCGSRSWRTCLPYALVCSAAVFAIAGGWSYAVAVVFVYWLTSKDASPGPGL